MEGTNQGEASEFQDDWQQSSSERGELWQSVVLILVMGLEKPKLLPESAWATVALRVHDRMKVILPFV